MLILTMFLLGMLFGFIGAGGVGFIIAVLIRFFEIPVYTALGTAMVVMALTMISGVISHFKEGNICLKEGITMGLFGAIGSYAGTYGVRLIPEDYLLYFSGGFLYLAAFAMWFKTRMEEKNHPVLPSPFFFFFRLALIGILTGGISGLFGIGSSPFIQVGLLFFAGLSLNHTAGTTMIIILPIAILGSVGFYQAGFVDWELLFHVVIGTITGSYLGAKFTNRTPKFILRWAMIGTPIAAGTLLITI